MSEGRRKAPFALQARAAAPAGRRMTESTRSAAFAPNPLIFKEKICNPPAGPA